MADFQEKIDSYRMWTEDIGGEYGEPFTDVFETFCRRDKIENEWENLSPIQRAEVQQIDDVLLTKLEFINEILPLPLEATEENRQKGHWWWFLDEGPQVREQIGRARENG